MNILIPGIYPRSENLVRATRDFDRDRVSSEELIEARGRDIEDLYELQSGFEYKSTGQFNWQDLQRPFSEIAYPCKVRGLSRFFETNTFWRMLDFKDEVLLVDEKVEEWIEEYIFMNGYYSEDNKLIVTLPFLYLMMNFTYGISLEKISKLLLDIIFQLSRYDNLIILFYEPTFGWREISEEEKRYGVEFLNIVKDTFIGSVFLGTSFFSLERDKDFIFDLPVDGIGIDFYANSVDEIMASFPDDKTLLAGVLNVESTLVEEKGDIRTFIKHLQKYIPIDRVYLCPNGPPELLPRDVMDEKILNLKGVIE